MYSFRRVSFLLILAGCLLSSGVASASTDPLPPDSWLLPFDVNVRDKPPIPLPDSTPPLPVFTQQEIYEFMWQSFIALNWPHKDGGSRGEPDTQKSLAPWSDTFESAGPVVWETYRRPDQVFLPPKLWPFSWDDELPQEVCFPGSDPAIKVLNVNATDYSESADGINQPFTQAHYPTGPVLDQNKHYLRYEVTLNQSYFSYIKHFKYFNPKKQIRAVKAYINFVEKFDKAPPPLRPGTPGRFAKFFQPLPNGNEEYLTRIFQLPRYALQGITEVKAAWKVLDGDDVHGRFYRRQVFFLNPNGECTGPHLVGLVGFHIHRVVPFGTGGFDHVGATFEQVDNVSLTPDDSPFPLPPHPSLNPGLDSDSPPPYSNGYEVEGQSGFSQLIPEPLPDGKDLPPIADRPITNVSRVVPIPADVQEVNTKFRDMLQGSVWNFYEMIGTDNPNLNDGDNPNLGTGILGAQTANTQNLMNTTLESYTQSGWSCSRCHLNAFPQGVTLPFPSFEEKFKALHVISFLLLNAQSHDQGKHGLKRLFKHLKPIWKKESYR